jgi:predicted ester cyclase
MQRSRLSALLTIPFAAAMAISASGAWTTELGLAQEATPAVDCPLATPEENMELVQQWFTALAAGNSAEVAAVASPDLIYHAPSQLQQPDDTETWANKRLQDYPDLDVTVEHVFSAGDMAASYVRFAGTHSDDAEDAQGIPATGLRTEWVTMVNFRIECGKIAEVWSVADDLGRLRQLGVISDAELQSVDPVATPTQ